MKSVLQVMQNKAEAPLLEKVIQKWKNKQTSKKQTNKKTTKL